MDVEEILDIGVTAITDAMKNFPDGDIKDYISSHKREVAAIMLLTKFKKDKWLKYICAKSTTTG